MPMSTFAGQLLHLCIMHIGAILRWNPSYHRFRFSLYQNPSARGAGAYSTGTDLRQFSVTMTLPGIILY